MMWSWILRLVALALAVLCGALLHILARTLAGWSPAVFGWMNTTYAGLAGVIVLMVIGFAAWSLLAARRQANVAR